MASVLVVEDEPRMRSLIADALAREGHRVTAVGDGYGALLAGREAAFDAASIDIALPGMSGLELCRHLRREHPSVGLLLVTARDALEDRVRGLDIGADDYLVKPFAMSELSARLRAVLRRLGQESGVLHVGGLTIDPRALKAEVDGRALAVSMREFALLRALAARAEEVVERETLLREVWGDPTGWNPAILDQYVSYLRRKLVAHGPAPSVDTVRGVGYRLRAR